MSRACPDGRISHNQLLAGRRVRLAGLAALFSIFTALPAISETEVEAIGSVEVTVEAESAVDSNDGATAATDRDGPVFEVDQFALAYAETRSDHPSLVKIFPHQVVLQPTVSGYIAPRPGGASERVTLTQDQQSVARFHASALAKISRSLLRATQELGLLGIYVLPDPRDIDPHSEQDLRGTTQVEGEPASRLLRFVVTTGRVQEVRTVAVGSRIDGSWVVDHKYHAEIREGSPLQPELYAGDGTTDLIQKELLEDYLFKLNRHPGRHVEAALAASEDGTGVALDYRVHEPRPLTAYLQVADTGTRRTNLWQSRLGFIHRQLTNRDDILNLEYLNAGFNNLNGISGSYESPWFGGKRPRWMKTSGFEPSWLSWVDRDKIPWWGSDRLRWRVSGGFSRVEIGLGLQDEFEVTEAITKDWRLGGQLIHQTWQHKNLFVDTFVGTSVRRVDFKNTSISNRGSLELTTGTFGAKIERVNEYSSLRGRLGLEVGSASGSKQDVINQGRTDADKKWFGLYWHIGVSHYLEPLLNREAWADPSTAESSTLAHEISLSFRGQYSDDRLIPQLSQVIGGLYSVRGFEQGASVGDSVYIGSAEYRFHVPRALAIRREPIHVPLIGDFRASPQQVYGRPDWDLVLRGFVDLGYSDRNGGIDVFENDQLLMSAGVGLEATFKGNLRLRTDWARGIVETHSNRAGRVKIDDTGKFHFLFSVSY
jgi:hypothetical protein